MSTERDEDWLSRKREVMCAAYGKPAEAFTERADILRSPNYDLLKVLSDKGLHVHTLEFDFRVDVIKMYCNWEKDEYKRSFANTCGATHYIMHKDNVVYVGTVANIEQFVRGFNEQ